MAREQFVAPHHLLVAHGALDFFDSLRGRLGGQLRSLPGGQRLQPLVIAGQHLPQSLGLGIGVDRRLQLAQPLLLRLGQRQETFVLAQ